MGLGWLGRLGWLGLFLAPSRLRGTGSWGGLGQFKALGTGSCGARVARKARVARVALGRFRT